MNTTALPRTLNRDAATGAFQIPADGWLQLVPLGEIAAPMEISRGGKTEEVEIRQIVSAQTVNRLVAEFKAEAAKPNFPGLLVDFDHFSNDPEKTSRAAGWIEEVAARDDGLWGRVRFSASGKAAVEGGDFRLFSPVLGFPPRSYKAGEVVEPAVLLRGALTNDPRYKGMVPVSHRDTPSPSQPMNKELVIALLAALGQTVAADASPEAFDAAIKSATEKAGGMKNEHAQTMSRVTQLEKDLVESDLDKAGLQGTARDAARPILTKNRAEGLAFIAALGAGKAAGDDYAVTHNRGTARAPAAGADQTAEEKAAEVRAAKVSCRAREIRKAKPGVSLADSYSTAEAEISAEEAAKK